MGGLNIAPISWHLCLLGIAVALLPACEGRSAYATYQGQTMGTVYRVTARCPLQVGRAIDEELMAVNQQMSTYLPDSELSQLNAAPLNVWFGVSAELFEVLEAAQALSRQSRGAFDVTVGPLVNLWGFGAQPGPGTKPAEDQISRVRQRVGHAHLELRRVPPAVNKRLDVFVDLSAIAKGHGVDRVAARLDRVGCSDFMVEVGGEVKARGVNPQGSPWRIGIEVPDLRRLGGVQRVLGLRGSAVATSGDYRNYAEYDGQRYSHTIDPRTGMPITHNLASATVVHESALWADGFATVVSVLGPQDGWAFAQEHGLAALLVVREQNGFEERYTKAMEPHLL